MIEFDGDKPVRVDAIIVSAGGPHVPEALKQQLAIGGRLIVPVGEFGFQTLIRERRTGEDRVLAPDLRVAPG